MTKKWSLLAILLLLVVLYALSERTESPGPKSPHAADAEILDAFAEQRSGILVETSGVIERTLPDDLEGSRHQRFILRMAGGHTLLVSHNIDLAPRVPLSEGDLVEIRGQYEWNERGGVVHWTHHDPDGNHPGGWIRHRGRLYE